MGAKRNARQNVMVREKPMQEKRVTGAEVLAISPAATPNDLVLPSPPRGRALHSHSESAPATGIPNECASNLADTAFSIGLLYEWTRARPLLLSLFHVAPSPDAAPGSLRK
ncbi:hypothetical protein HPB50_018541 [Hyalomma asiaticum]|uniref:Uncharacterized protein n=1 Tax=Hyalomma asiaticum TaxID=266040 RepID=A0ACB7TJP3_HYAAI|nr:hypothetical protein HPB50_018541 [Hyalomma asiaticum]